MGCCFAVECICTPPFPHSVMRAFACALLLVALAASVSGRQFWSKLHCSPAKEATVNFQLYLKWENEAALNRYVDTGRSEHLSFNPRAGDISSTLANWRALLNPTTAAHADVAARLQRSDVAQHCATEWDSVHCTNVPVAAAQALFQREFCAFRENLQEVFAAAPHLKTAVQKPGTFLLIDAIPAELTNLPAAIKYVGGVTVFDPTVRPHRREIAPRTPTADVPNHYWPVVPGSNQPVIISGLGMPEFGSANQMAFAVVTLACKNGKQAASSNANSTSPLNSWCDPNIPFPIEVQLAMTGFGSVLVPLTEQMCAPVSSQTFESNFWPLIFDQTSPIASNIACQIDISSFVYNNNIPTWAQIGISATAVFSDLSSSNTTVMSGFWQQDFGLEMKATWPNPMGPADIRNLYQVPAGESIVDGSSAQGILEFSDTEFPRSGFQVSDLRTYLVQYGVVSDADADAYLKEYLTILGGAAGESRGETSLDIEMMMSIAKSGHTYLWNIWNGPNSTYLHWAQAFIAWGQTVTSKAASNPTLDRPSSVWSISYGGPEWSNATEMSMLNNYFKLLSASGVTVVVSSGDSGAGFQPPLVEAITAPAVSFPASSPYVVAAGATALKAIDALVEPVFSVCSTADGNVITSGGGFSQAFDLPAFQSAQVAAYLAKVGSGSQYPSNKRAIPDVAAIGAWVNIVMSNMTIPVFGTSISAPVFSSLVALVNDHLRRNGKPTISLANNIFYNMSANVSIFSDVTIGSNCAGEQYRYPANFPTYPPNACYTAIAGWDAASGLGSPSYPALATVIVGPSWNQNGGSPSPSKSNTGAIVGGAVGGVVVAGLAVLAFFKFRRTSELDGEADRLVQ